MLIETLELEGWQMRSVFHALIRLARERPVEFVSAFVGGFLTWGICTTMQHYVTPGSPWFAKGFLVVVVGLIFWKGHDAATAITRAICRTNLHRLLNDHDLPSKFRALEMLWPKRLREEVWHPAFSDEEALYLELRRRAWLPMLNVLFALKVFYLVAVTGRIAALDGSLSRLTDRRSRLTGKTARRQGKID